MSKAEIIAELPRLSAEERAEVQAKLDELAVDRAARRPARVRSPRLADPKQASDFRKRIVPIRAVDGEL